MTDTNPKPKKSTKKWIYIGAGLAVFILIAAGAGFWLWNRSKSSNKSDSADQKEEDINEEELPTEIKEHRKKNWVNLVTGMNDYSIPSLPDNISVSRAKDELLEALWQWAGKPWDKKKIGKTLEKNAQRINLADKKGNEEDPLFGVKLLESVAEKYQQNIFSSLPKQKKFEESLSEARTNLHFLRTSFTLKYKSEKKIDWVASLWEYKKRDKSKTKIQQEKDFAKMTNHLEREINPFIGVHINKFPSLTNLKELNQWTNILARKMAAASRVAFDRFALAEKMGKKILSPAKEEGIVKKTFTKQKNEKFGLEPVVVIFKA
jgi:hypothetical protein